MTLSANLALTEFLSTLPATNNKLSGDVYHPGLDLLGSYRDPTDTCAPRTPLELLADSLHHQDAIFPFILFGEVHDNPWHHKIRSQLLNLLEDKRRTASPRPIVFEQLTSELAPTLDLFNAGPAKEKSTDQFLKAIGWASSGWAQYDYRPLFDAALAAKMPIYAGDVPKSLIRQAAKQGETAIAPEERARLKLDVPLPASQQDAILTELEASHCGMMPKSAFTGMAFAQRLRDATLADVALKAQAAHGAAIVMAGNGHVRGDRGIAWYIRSRAPRINVVTVALVEVEDGKTDPAAYVPRDPDGKPAVDYVVFTPKHVRPDPCDAFKKKP